MNDRSDTTISIPKKLKKEVKDNLQKLGFTTVSGFVQHVLHKELERLES